MTGWLTLVTAIIAILYGIFVAGIYNQDWTQAIAEILFGLGLLGLGRKVSRVEKKVG